MTDGRVVRVSGAGELVQAVPYLVGYHPRESLVVLSLDGPRRRVGATGCVPLPPRGSAALLDEVVRTALRPLAATGVDRVLAVVYPRRRPASTGALPERAVVRALRSVARESGVAVEDALLVWEGRWWSYLCSDARCCPVGGRLVEGATGPAAVVAAMVAEGVAPASSRDDLAAALRPGAVEDGTAGSLDRAVRRARARVAGAPGPATRAATSAALRRILARAEDEVDGQSVDDADADTAAVLVGLRDVVARDAALCLVADAQPRSAVRALRRLVRRAPPALVAPVATVLAMAAYLDGNGAVANVAVDRALDADPSYRMALLLRDALTLGTHPSVLRQLVEEIREEVMPPAG